MNPFQHIIPIWNCTFAFPTSDILIRSYRVYKLIAPLICTTAALFVPIQFDIGENHTVSTTPDRAVGFGRHENDWYFLQTYTKICIHLISILDGLGFYFKVLFLAGRLGVAWNKGLLLKEPGHVFTCWQSKKTKLTKQVMLSDLLARLVRPTFGSQTNNCFSFKSSTFNCCLSTWLCSPLYVYELTNSTSLVACCTFSFWCCTEKTEAIKNATCISQWS